MRIVLIIATCVAACVAAGPAGSAEPGTVRVAVALDGLPWSGGVVGSGRVTLAVGFDAEAARVVARRLGLRPVFVRVPRERLGKPGPWELAVGVRDGVPVLRGDHVVVVAPGVTRPRSLGGARGAHRLRPARNPGGRRRRVAARSPPGCWRAHARSSPAWCGPGRCDVALSDAGDATRLGGRPVARIESAVGYGIGVSRASGLGASLTRELRILGRNGTLGRLARSWLGLDPARLPRLR